ncbi:glycoside hydrolase family 16 protein [Prolixibacteraceae bacterium]|nr:glycoside hydrolase family 16 protein [Prolixibacteraceae bacterium]
MGFLFTLKYKLGLFPTYDKISKEWDQILDKKRNLDKLHNSQIVSEYLQLREQYGDISVSAGGNPEAENIKSELAKLEKNKKVKKFIAQNSENIDNQPFDVIHYMELKATLENMQKPAPVEAEEQDVNKTRYIELAASSEVKQYLALQSESALDYFNSNALLLDESFLENNTMAERWSFEPQYSDFSGGSYSQVDDLHLYQTSNVKASNKGCDITLQRESKDGKVWSGTMGFIPRKFSYTSGMMHSNNVVTANKLSVEVAAKFNPQEGVVNALVLKDRRNGKMIDLFRTGGKGVGFGTFDENASNHTSLKSIDFGRKHVYRIDIEDNEIVWFLNNQEVARQSGAFRGAEWDIAALVAAKKENVQPTNMTLDWIRVVDHLV